MSQFGANDWMPRSHSRHQYTVRSLYSTLDAWLNSCLLAAGIAVAAMLIGILIALAVAPVTAGARWPGPLDILREHPWQSVGGLAVVAAALAAASVLTADAARASANLGDIR